MCPFCKKQCENIPSRQTWWLLGRLAAVAWKQDVMMKVGVWDLPTYMESSSISKHLRWLTSLISVSSILLLFPFKHHGVVQLAKLFGLLLSFPFAKVKHRCPFSWPSAGTRRQWPACGCGDLESSCLAWQVANYPLVPDEPPPDELWTFPQVAWFLNVAGISFGFGTWVFGMFHHNG